MDQGKDDYILVMFWILRDFDLQHLGSMEKSKVEQRKMRMKACEYLSSSTVWKQELHSDMADPRVHSLTCPCRLWTHTHTHPHAHCSFQTLVFHHMGSRSPRDGLWALPGVSVIFAALLKHRNGVGVGSHTQAGGSEVTCVSAGSCWSQRKTQQVKRIMMKA